MNTNSKGIAQILILVTLASVIASGIGFWAYKNGEIRLTTQQKIPEIQIPSPATDSTSDWKIYTNTKYKYELKYPNQDWYFDWLVPPKPDENIQTFDSISLLKTTTVTNKYINQTVWWMRFSVSVILNPNHLTPKELYYFGQYTKDIPAGFSTTIQFDEVYLKELRSKVAKETTYPPGVLETTFQGLLALSQTYEKWGLLTFNKGKNTFQLSWSIEDGKETSEDAQKIFDQILSTVKFLE